jgi:hypothetical protein
MNKFNIGRRIKIVNTVSNDEIEFPISYQNEDTGILCSKIINGMVQVILDKDDEYYWINKTQMKFI